MGRNRKSTRAIEQKVYDIFGNVTAIKQKKKYDILGNIISGRTPPPAPAARATSTASARTTQPTPTQISITNTNTTLPITNAYTDKTIFNPEMLPVELQKFVEASHQAFAQRIRGSALRGWWFENAISQMQDLGLNPDIDDDVRLFADLTSYPPPELRWTPTAEDIEAQRQRSGTRLQVAPDGTLGYSTHASRSVEVSSGEIKVYNSNFGTSRSSPPGIGYVMVARQLAAARKIADRTGKSVRISVSAVTGGGGQGSNMNGFYTWPKLGYTFDIPYHAKESLKQMGFTDEQLTNSATLMLSTNPQGMSGFDAWLPALRNASLTDVSGSGKVTVTPTSARSKKAKNYSLAEQVTREYGKRRGFVKRAASVSSTQFDNFFSNNDTQDEIILSSIWRDLAKKYKG